MKHVAVGDRAEGPFGPDDVVDAFLALDVHSQALESVGDFAHHRAAVQSADLLKISELRDFHAIQPDLPSESPGTQGGRLPVVFDEADVVDQGVEAERAQRAQIQLLKIVGRGFDGDLELIVVLQPEWVLAIATVGGPARGLHVRRAPGLRADGAQEGRGVEGARSHFHVVGLQDDATPQRPIGLKGKDQVLKSARRRLDRFGHGAEYSHPLQALSCVAKSVLCRALFWGAVQRPGRQAHACLRDLRYGALY